MGGLTADRLCPRPFIDLARTRTKYKVEAMQSRNQKLHCLVRFEVQTYERQKINASIVGVLQVPLDKDQTVTQSDKSQYQICSVTSHRDIVNWQNSRKKQ